MFCMGLLRDVSHDLIIIGFGFGLYGLVFGLYGTSLVCIGLSLECMILTLDCMEIASKCIIFFIHFEVIPGKTIQSEVKPYNFKSTHTNYSKMYTIQSWCIHFRSHSIQDREKPYKPKSEPIFFVNIV